MVGEHVGCGAADEPVGELGPVVVPRGLGDLHGDVRVLGVEVVGALLVGRQLIGVPEPVTDFAGGVRGVDHSSLGVGVPAAAGVGTTAGGEGQTEDGGTDDADS